MSRKHAAGGNASWVPYLYYKKDTKDTRWNRLSLVDIMLPPASVSGNQPTVPPETHCSISRYLYAQPKNEFDTKMPWFVGERPEAWSWEARELLAAARCATRVDMWARCSLEELSERLGWIVLGNQPPPWAACFQASSPGGAVPGGGEEGEASWLVECPDVIVQGVSTPVVVKRSSCDGIGRGWGGGEGKCGLGDSVHLSLIPENEQGTTGGSPSTPEIGLGGAGGAGEVATWSAVVSIWRGFGVASVRVVRMPCSSPTETLEL